MGALRSRGMKLPNIGCNVHLLKFQLAFMVVDLVRNSSVIVLL